MGLFRSGGFFNDLTSTINPFDDKNGAFQGSSPRVKAQPVSPGANYMDDYWSNFGQQAQGQAQQISNQTQNALNDYGSRSAGTGEAYGSAISNAANQSGVAGQGAAADVGATAGQSGQLGAYNAGQMSNLGRFYGNQQMGAGDSALNYGMGQGAGLAQLGQGMSNYGQGQAGAIAGGANDLSQYGQSQATNIGQNAGLMAQQAGNLNSMAGGAQGQNVSGAQQTALMGLEAQQGPSAAQAQLQSATNRNQNQALAMARSGRGFGGSASAMRQAAGQQAQMGQEAANQSAQLRSQEDAAWRQRQAANIGQAGQLASNEAAIRNQREQGLYGLGMQGMNNALGAQLGAGQLGVGAMNSALGAQLGAGQLGLGGMQAGGQMAQAGAGVGQNAYGQYLGALGNAANTQIGAQQAAGQMGLAGLGQQGALQGQAGQLALGGYGQQGALLGQAAGTQMGGYGQAGNMAANAGNFGLNSLGMQNQFENQRYGWGQQSIQNQLQAGGINNGLALQQQNQGNQMTGAYLGAGGSMLSMIPMLASDRNMKEGIEPTNVTLEADKGAPEIVVPKAGTEQVTEYDPYSFGTGISGPNQAQGLSSNQASQAASVEQQKSANTTAAKQPIKADQAAQKYGIGAQGATPWSVLGRTMQVGAQNAMGDVGVNPVTGRSWYDYSPQAPVVQPGSYQMLPVTSDERAKKAMKAIDEAPGYSYDYKDPDAMGATHGRQFGVMAQDLEKTPAGRSVVREGPQGQKMVDTSRLTMVNTAAMNALSDRLAKLEARIGGKKAA